MQFELIHKRSFTNQLRAVSKDRIPHILDKVEALRKDPRPDGYAKEKMTEYKGKGDLYRFRVGDYRVIYAFGDGWVTLVGVGDREDVYGPSYSFEEPSIDLSTVPRDEELTHLENMAVPVYTGNGSTRPKQHDFLPRRVDNALLQALRVPAEFFPVLLGCRTVDDLIEADVPEEVRIAVFDATGARDLEEMMAEPSYMTGETDDLLRYVEGELLGFLLKLDPTQERMVDWGMKGTGPTLVKGGPGTGKSTVALYRVQAMVQALKASGVRRPRILYTTYTNALVAFSEQLLRRLLGPEAAFVEVRTADWVVHSVLKSLGIRYQADNKERVREIFRAAMYSAFEGTGGWSVKRLTPEYMFEEISTVIEAREISSFEEYLVARRTGRRVPLSRDQRQQIWAIYEDFCAMLDREGLTTWNRIRRRAVQAVRAGAGPKPYDGVVIDEVQDLDPTALRLLVQLCAAPNRLFITADANQSIYGSTFRWTDVHDDLKFRGRTELLKRNYRSTREIGEAANSYLRNGALDDEQEREYVESGLIPTMREVSSIGEETNLLASYLPAAAREYHLNVGSCAVLVPTNRTGQAIAQRLRAASVAAEFMESRDLDLEKRVVKVITLKAAKGLEFPVVAIAGFVENPTYGLQAAGEIGEQEERLFRERRSMFVGMTRAMRALLVVAPKGARSPLFEGFDRELWNIRQPQVV